jgi:hypothetical protein
MSRCDALKDLKSSVRSPAFRRKRLESRNGSASDVSA